MDTNLAQILETTKTIFNFNIVRRLFFLASVTASVMIGVSMYGWIQEPSYRPLAYELSDQNMASIIDTLEKANIPFKISHDKVLVPEKEVLNAKMRLANAGIAKNDNFSFSYLNESSQLGSSQFLENARYVRALEADLARTITAIQSVSSAKVHIAMPPANVFADENAKTTASIILQLTPGHETDKEKIRAIIQLVAASVPELDPANVAITDQYGHYLSSMLNPDSLLNQEQLSYQNHLQDYYQRRIQSLITPIVGENKASINVNTDIDFTVKEQSQEAYDPDKKAIRSEQSVSESTTGSGSSGVPGALSNQPTGDKPADSGSSGESRNESTKNYEVTKSLSYIKNSTPKIKSIAVAVVLDNETVMDEKTKKATSKPLDKQKIDKITELVKSTIGFNQKRGDTVTVINASFIPAQIETIPPVAIWKQEWFFDYIKKILGILIGTGILFTLYRKVMPELKNKTPLVDGHSHITDGNLANQLITPEMLQLKNEQIQILKELAEKEPNKVAGIIKKWVAK